MPENRCLHDLLPDQCGLCRSVPSGLTDRVVVTAGGRVFHGDRGCEALLEGQRKVRSRGGEVSDVEVVPLTRVLHDRPPCVLCFPDYAPKGTRLCWVRDDETWYRGLLRRWTGRDGAGRWKADVAYVRDRVQVEETLDQRRLLPREPGEGSPLSTR
ncbi:hypothetical protein ACFW3Z_21910 [Nocardiopsis alba]|uniref:hypothetical protein n=1 Tax=Nocardiopsis alba TaxID=53437 RepID=UPI00366BD6B8